MKKLIGFATQFYTLWDYEEIPQFENLSQLSKFEKQ